MNHVGGTLGKLCLRDRPLISANGSDTYSQACVRHVKLRARGLPLLFGQVWSRPHLPTEGTLIDRSSPSANRPP